MVMTRSRTKKEQRLKAIEDKQESQERSERLSKISELMAAVVMEESEKEGDLIGNPSVQQERRYTIGRRTREKVFPTRVRRSTSSSEGSLRRGDRQILTQTPKFGGMAKTTIKEAEIVTGSTKTKRIPPPSPRNSPQDQRATVQKGVDIQPSSEAVRNDLVMVGKILAMQHDNGGILHQFIPTLPANEINRKETAEEISRQQWIRWTSWILGARQLRVEEHLPLITQYSCDNLEPGICNYEVELARMVFRAITTIALGRYPTEEEFQEGLREGFIRALQLRDTTCFTPEVQ